MLRRRQAVLLITAFLLIFFTGCKSQMPQSGEAPTENKESIQQKTDENKEKSSEEKQSKTLIDQMGKQVVLPEKADRVVMSALPLPSIYALTNAPIDKIVGMHPGSRSAIKNSIMGSMYPELLDVPTNFVEGTDINVEELLKLNPSIVFYWGPYANQTEKLNAMEIPAIGVKTQGDGDALLTLSTWLTMMGEVFDKEAEVKKVVDYGEKTLSDITQVVSKIPRDQKIKSMFLFKHSAQEIVVPGTGHYGNYWIEKTGGINVAKDIDVTANVNMEQIYQWNPEAIFISSFTTTFPEDLYENKIDGQDWSQIEAVKNKRVYKVPVGVYRWYPPSGDVPLMMKWMALKQYPDMFSYDMKSEIKDYYENFYKYSLAPEQIDSILVPVKETAEGTAGFGKQK